jgi:hypothetical protein
MSAVAANSTLSGIPTGDRLKRFQAAAASLLDPIGDLSDREVAVFDGLVGKVSQCGGLSSTYVRARAFVALGLMANRRVGRGLIGYIEDPRGMGGWAPPSSLS